MRFFVLLFDKTMTFIYNLNMDYGTVIHYSSPQDDVVNFGISPKKIDEKYIYVHKNPFYRFFSFITYWLIAKPIACLHYKLHGYKIVNRKLLKSVKGGYFIYGNHTAQILDAFGPTHIIKGKNPQIICDAENVSNGLVGKLIRMWGAIPLPSTIAATRNFNTRIEQSLKKGQPVLIYPEAHLWPYYTKIRKFNDTSFHYPVKYKKPIFTFTTTYQLKKTGKKPRIVVYIDGPFYPDETLSAKQQRAQLCEIAYNKMCERSLNSNYEYVKYVYDPTDNSKNDSTECKPNINKVETNKNLNIHNKTRTEKNLGGTND